MGDDRHRRPWWALYNTPLGELLDTAAGDLVGHVDVLRLELVGVDLVELVEHQLDLAFRIDPQGAEVGFHCFAGRARLVTHRLFRILDVVGSIGHFAERGEMFR